MEEGKIEVSPGYNLNLDFTPGIHPDYGPYDAVQYNIRYNHVAIVDKGRAGQEVALHLDSAMEVTPSTQPAKDKPSMETIQINAVGYEVSTAVAQAYRAERSGDQARFDSVQAKLDASVTDKSALEAERDSLKSDLDKSKTAHNDAADPAKISELVQTRVALVSVAAPILNLDAAEVVKLEEVEIKRQVITAINPAMAEKVANADSAYLDVAYDYAITSHAEAPSEGLANIQPNLGNPDGQVNLDTADLRTLRKEVEKRNLDAAEVKRNLWQQPLMSAEGECLDPRRNPAQV